MLAETQKSQKVNEAVAEAFDHYGTNQDELIPILNRVNKALGYLPAEALEEISKKLKLPKSHLFSTASFYHMLSTKPRGKHIVQFCESAPCHVVGGREVWEALQNELQLKSGETSEDKKWTLITTSCLGLCGVGPVIIVNDDIYGNVTPEQVPEILSYYR